MVSRPRPISSNPPKLTKPQLKKAKKWWLSNTVVKPETVRLGNAVIILGKLMKFNRLLVNDAGRKAPPIVHFTMGEQRALCVNTQSDKFILNEIMDNQQFAVAEMLRQSVSVFL